METVDLKILNTHLTTTFSIPNNLHNPTILTYFINKSLYVLGKVIAGLVRTHGEITNSREVPFRDSKLTKLMINSLGGNGRTMLIACISESSAHVSETLRTLKFSTSCARIRNRPIRQFDPQSKIIIELRNEIKCLKLDYGISKSNTVKEKYKNC